VAEPTTEEPWSSYRKLNHGLQRLASILAEAEDHETSAPGAAALATELAVQAKTVETAAMVRAMQFVMDTVIKDASARAIEGESVVYTVSLAKKDLQHLIDQVGR